jgi:hypothetical protein
MMEELKQKPVPMAVLNVLIWSAMMLQVQMESILITTTINAKQKHDVMTADIPNAFVQTDLDKKNQVKASALL